MMNPELAHIDEYLSGPNANNSELPDLHLWINSDQLRFHLVELPDVPKGKWMALLPWILEDELLLPVEEMHLVICSVDTDGQARVISIPKKEIYRLQLLLEDKPARVRTLSPDVFALPLEEGFITLAQVGERLLVRTGMYQGFSGEADFVWQILELQRSQGEVFQIQCFGVAEETVPRWAQDSCSFNANAINWQFSELPSDANLLVGEFRPKAAQSLLGDWMPNIGMGAIALCLLISLAIVDHLKTGQELQLINQQLAREYEASFGVSLSAPERAQSEGARLISEREVRYFSLSDSILPMSLYLDSALSRCTDCGLASVQIEPDKATLVMRENTAALATMRNQEGFSLSNGTPNEQQQIVVNIERQAL
jgi:type II secretion system protein L